MSCENPLQSFGAVIQRAANYADGCGALRVTEVAEGDAIDCGTANLSDLTLLVMALDEAVDTLNVVTTNVLLADLCDDYSPAIDCDGVSVEQAMRAAVTVDGGTATIRVLYVTDGSGACLSCADAEMDLMHMAGASVVTDGTDTYILAVDPSSPVSTEVSCDTADVGGQTLARAALASLGSCGMWAWRVAYGDGVDDGAFDSGFGNGFDIAT